MSFQKDEFISCAAIGVARALKKFNPGRASKIKSYAFPYIREEIRLLLTNNINQNKYNRFLNDKVKSSAVGGHKWPQHLCFNDIINSFDHTLNEKEKKILTLKYCGNLSDFKISRKFNVKTNRISKIVGSAHAKLKHEISQYGDIEDIYDIRDNIEKAFCNHQMIEMKKKFEDDNANMQQ
jgi:RNA polymerase sigma factor (sigma-70 family)